MQVLKISKFLFHRKGCRQLKNNCEHCNLEGSQKHNEIKMYSVAFFEKSSLICNLDKPAVIKLCWKVLDLPCIITLKQTEVDGYGIALKLLIADIFK
jgi:hypothetical protein